MAVRAAESKKATDIRVLDLTSITAFADYFVICTGANARNVQAIADEVGLRLKQTGELPFSVEGYNQAEWILADYGNFLVHIFAPKSREYYDLERLWRNAKTVEFRLREDFSVLHRKAARRARQCHRGGFCEPRQPLCRVRDA